MIWSDLTTGFDGPWHAVTIYMVAMTEIAMYPEMDNYVLWTRFATTELFHRTANGNALLVAQTPRHAGQ